MKRKVALLLVVLLVLQPFWPVLASAQEPVRAGVVTTLAGRATVARTALPAPLDLKFKDDVFVRDRIRTEQNSVVRMLMGGKAVVTVRELSELMITEEATRSTVNLESGKIALSVARQRMRPGEAIEIRTPNAIAGVRGTVVIAEIVQASAQGPTPAPVRVPPTTNWYVLRGSIDVFRRDLLTAPPTRVNQLESLSMTGTTVGPVRPIPPQQLGQILSGLKTDPQHRDTPEGTKKDVSNKEQAKATALASLIAPERGPAAPKKEEEGKKEEGKKEEKGGGEQQQQQQQQQAAAAEQPPSGPPTGPPPTGGTDTGTPPPVAATAPPTPPPVDLPVFTAPPPAPPVVAPPPPPTILPPVTNPLPTAPTPLVTINGLSVALGATGQLITVTSGTTNQVTATAPPLPPPFVVATGPSPSISGPLGGPTVQLTGASVTATAGGPALATVTGTTTSATAALVSASGKLPAATFTIDSARPLLGLASLVTIASALTLTGGASASFSGDAINLTTGTLTTTGDLFGVSGASSLSVGGSLLTLPSGTPAVSVGGAVASVVGGTLTGSASGTPLIKVLAGSLGVTRNLVEVASTLTLTGPVLTVGGGRTVTAGGGLKASGSTVTFTGTELVNLSGASTFSAAGPFLDLTNTTLALGTGSGARLSVGSMTAKNTLTNTVGPPVRLTGSALTGTGALITTDGTGNRVSLAGSIELTNSSVSLGTLASIGTGDTFTQALATGDDATVKMTNSSLTLGPTATALNLLAPLARIDGVNGVLAAPNYITLTGAVNLGGEGANDLITLASLGVSLAEPVLKATGNTLTLSAGGLLGVSGTATSTTTSPLISLDPVTVSAGGDLFRIKPTGSLSVAGALVSDTSGSLVVFGNFLTVQGGLTATGTPALIQLTGSTVSSGSLAGPTHFVQITGATGQATLGGPLLTASGTFSLTQGGSAVLEVSSGGKLTGSSTSPFISLTGGILGLGSGVTATLIETGSTATLAGGLFKAVSTTISLPATPGPFLQVTGASSLTVAGPFIDLTSTLPATLSLGTAPLAKVLSGSTLKNSAGAAVKLSGVSLTADSLLNSDGAANIIDSAGILDLTDGTVTLRRLLDPPSPSTDKFRSSRALNQPAISVTSTLASSTLTTTATGDGLVFLGDGSLATLPTEQGVALVATATGLLTTTINVKGLLVDVEATTYTATNALAQLTKTTVNQTLTTPATTQFLNSLILIDGSGKSFTMAGPMLRATNATLNVTGPEVFNLENGTLTNTSASAFFNLDPTTITAPDFGRLGKGGNLTLGAPFLAGVGGTISISNPGVNTLLTKVSIGDFLGGLAITPDGGRLYVGSGSFGSSRVSVIDTAKNTVTATIPVASPVLGAFNLSVAVTPDGSRAYVLTAPVTVINTATNAIVTTVSTGANPNAIAITPNGARVYVANSDGGVASANTVSVIDTATNTVTATIPVGMLPDAIAITPDGSRAYVTHTCCRSASDNTVSVINTATNTVIASIPVGSLPADVAVSRDGTRAYVANSNSNSVSVIDTAANVVTATITGVTGGVVTTGPSGIAITPDGTRVYAPAGNDSFVVISTATNTVLATVNIGGSTVRSLVFAPDGSRAYIRDFSGFNVSVIDINRGSFLTLVPGTTLTTTNALQPLVSLNGTALTLGGGFFKSASATTTLAGGLLKATTGSAVPPAGIGGPLVDLDKSSFTAGGSLADLTNYVVNLGSSPVILLKNKSTLKTTAGPVFKMSGGSLTADTFVTSDGSGNLFDATGPVADLTNTTVTFRAPSQDPVFSELDTNKFTLPADQAFLKLTSSTVTLTAPQTTDALIVLGDNDLAVSPTVAGVGLIATGTMASPSAINVKGRLLKLKAGTFTSLNPLLQLTQTNVAQTVTTADPLFRVNAQSKTISMAGPFLSAVSSTLGTMATPLSGPEVFQLEAGTLTNTSASAFFNLDPTTVAGRDFASLGKGTSLTVGGSFLADVGGTINISNTSVNTVANTVTVGTSPSAIALTADGARAYVANATSNTVSVVDSVTRTVTATVAVGTDPEGVAVKPDGSRVYVANKGSGTVSVIDAGTNTVIGSPITVGSSPNSVAVTPDGAQVYVANVVSNNVSVINTATNAVVATVPVGTTPAEVFIAPNGARAYVRNNGSANVSVINTATNAVIATVPVGANPEFIAFDPASGRAFVANQGATTVSVIDNTLAIPALLTTITVGTAPNAIAITPEGNKAYVANGGSGTVSVIDTRTNAVLATVTVGTSPQVPAVSPDGTRVYVPNAGSGSVSVIETKTNTVIATVTVGTSPDHVAIGPDGALAFVKNTGSSNLSVIDVNKGSFLTLGPGATFKTTGTAAFVDLSGTTMTFGGGLFRSLSATTTLGGPAFKASGVTLTAGGPLIDLDASSFTAAGPLVDLSGSTVNLGTSPVAFLKNKSTLKSTAGPTIKIVGGSLTADSLGLTNGNGNTFDLTGTVLDATSTTISLRTIGDSPDNDTDTDKFTRTLNQPFMKLTSTTLTTTLQNRDNLVDLGDNDPVTPPTEPGVALVATGTVASPTTITLSNRMFKLKAGTFTATNPLVQIDHTSVNQTVTLQSLVRIDPETKSITMTGPLFNSSDSTFGTFPIFGTSFTPLSGSMFSFENGSAAGVTANSTTTPFITMARDTVTTSRHFLDAFSNFVLTLQNSLLSATDTTVTTTSTSFSYFAVVDGAKITTTVTAAPLLSFTGTAASLAASTSKVTAARNFLPLAINTMGAAAPSMTLSGPLLTATLTAFKTGDPTANTFTFLFVGDSAQLTSTSASALMSFTSSSVDTAGNILSLRRSAAVATPSKVTLSGPLFTATGSTFDTTSLGFGAAFSTTPSACCAGFFVGQGAQLTSSAAAPLIQLTDSMFNAGPDAQSGGSFLILRDTESGFPATELVAPASVNLTNAGGSLLSVTNNGASTNTLSALFSLLNVQRSTFTSSGTGALITFGGTTGPTVTLGGTDPTITATPTTTFGRLVIVLSSATGGTAAPSNASITLAGQLLNSTKASITTTSDLVGVFNGATFTSSSTLTTPLVQVTNTSLNLGTASQNGFVFNVGGLGGTSGTSLATLNSSGPLLDASSGSPITATGGLLNVFAGGQVVMGTAVTPTTLPLFSITGGTHTLSSNAGTAGARFTGRSTATASEVDDGVTLTLGTDAPVSNHNGAGLQATGATITAQKAVKLDTALISASAPLLILQSASSFTTALDAMDLPQKAKLVSTGPIVKLDGSTLTVTTGAGVNVAGASLLRVIGDLIDIRNGGTLKVLAGPALNVTGNSVVNISGALVAFNGTSGNSVQITNTLCAPCTSFSGIPVFLTGGALSSNITVGPNPIKNLGTLGTVTLSSPILTTGGTAVIAVSGASSKVTITAP